MLCYVMSCYVMSCYVMLWYVTICYVVLCYDMSCCVIFCHVMLWYLVLSYLILSVYDILHWNIISDYTTYNTNIQQFIFHCSIFSLIFFLIIVSNVITQFPWKYADIQLTMREHFIRISSPLLLSNRTGISFSFVNIWKLTNRFLFISLYFVFVFVLFSLFFIFFF